MEKSGKVLWFHNHSSSQHSSLLLPQVPPVCSLRNCRTEARGSPGIQGHRSLCCSHWPACPSSLNSAIIFPDHLPGPLAAEIIVTVKQINWTALSKLNVRPRSLGKPTVNTSCVPDTQMALDTSADMAPLEARCWAHFYTEGTGSDTHSTLARGHTAGERQGRDCNLGRLTPWSLCRLRPTAWLDSWSWPQQDGPVPLAPKSPYNTSLGVFIRQAKGALWLNRFTCSLPLDRVLREVRKSIHISHSLISSTGAWGDKKVDGHRFVE